MKTVTEINFYKHVGNSVISTYVMYMTVYDWKGIFRELLLVFHCIKTHTEMAEKF